MRGELEARGGDLKAGGSKLCGLDRAGRKAGALSWRLRTEMSLARVRRQQGHADALTGVAETYARFSEGFETADLQAARLMLDKSPAR